MATDTPTAKSSGFRKWLPFPEITSLRDRNYRLWWISSSIESLNQFTTQMVLAWWVKVELDSPLLVGTIVLAFGIPAALFLFPAGLLADKWDRKKQLVLAQSVAVLAAFGLAIMMTLDVASFWIGCAFAFVLGSTVAFTNPARQSLIPMLVPRRLLLNAIVLGSLSMNTSRLIAPGIAGFLMFAIGVNAALFFIGSWLFVGIFSLLAIRIPVQSELNPETEGQPAAQKPERESVLTLLGGGLVFLWQTKPLMVLMLLYMATGLFITGPALTLVPIYVDDFWNAGSRELGLIWSAQAATSMIMGFYLSRLGALKNKGGWFAVSMIGGGGSFALYSISPEWFIGIIFFATFGIAAALYGGMSQTVLQTHTPRSVMGRVLSLNQLSIQGLMPLGAFIAGALAEFVSAQIVGFAGGILGFTMALLALILAKKFRNLS